MTFNTKLNIGDTIWHIRECITQTTIHQRSGYYQGEYQTRVVYGSDNNCNFAEENEGKFWWATRKGIIEHLTNSDDLFHPPTRSSKRDLQKAFENVFGPKQEPPTEKFKIVIPPDLQRRMTKLSKETAKMKPHCDRRHVTSELLLRMKPLASIREKTLSDYADEL